MPKTGPVLATWQALKAHRTTKPQRVVAAAIVRDRAPRNEREIKALAGATRLSPKAVTQALAELRTLLGVNA